MSVDDVRPRLRDAVLDHLRQEGSDSISGIARALRDRRPDAPVHRLTVAGYLTALADEGILQEVERPPSKHYRIADPDRVLTLHQRIGRIVADLDVPAPERPTLVVAVLQQLLGRPVFEAELHHAGYPRAGPGLEAMEVSEDERREYRALFRRRATSGLHIPHGDPLLGARAGAVRAGMVQEVLRRVVVSGLPGARDLTAGKVLFPQAVQARLRVEDTA